MSSSSVILDGFGTTTQRRRWRNTLDGAYETALMHRDDDVRVSLDLTTYLASGETVSSAAYTDRGTTTSSKSVSSPNVIFTITGIGETEVRVTLSTGRQVTAVFRTKLAESRGVRDYNE